MTAIGAPAPHDIFSDNQRWGDHAAVLGIERNPARFTNEPEPAGGHKALPIRYELTG